MRVTATTVSYDNIPRVVKLIINAPGRDQGRYCMHPSTWQQIEPIYANKPECILEYRWRNATEEEYESVQEVMKEMREQT